VKELGLSHNRIISGCIFKGFKQTAFRVVIELVKPCLFVKSNGKPIDEQPNGEWRVLEVCPEINWKATSQENIGYLLSGCIDLLLFAYKGPPTNIGAKVCLILTSISSIFISWLFICFNRNSSWL
jgi:hypothetical protein